MSHVTYTPDGVNIDIRASDEEFNQAMAWVSHQSRGEEIDKTPFELGYSAKIRQQYFAEEKPLGRREAVFVEQMSRADVMLSRVDSVSRGVHRIQARKLREDPPDDAPEEVWGRRDVDRDVMIEACVYLKDHQMIFKLERTRSHWFRILTESSAELRRLRKDRDAGPRSIPDSPVPLREDPGLPLVPQNADRSGVQSEQAPAVGRQPDPAGSKNPKNVPVRKKRRVSTSGRRTLDHAPRAGADLLHRLAVGNSVLPQVPAGPLIANLRRAAAFVIAIIPFLQIWLRLRDVAVAGQRACFSRPRHRTGQHQGELSPLQQIAHFPRIIAPAIGEWDICSPGVRARQAPFRLAMPHQPQHLFTPAPS